MPKDDTCKHGRHLLTEKCDECDKELSSLAVDTDGTNILKRADELIHGERRKAYGHPRDNFGTIAVMVNARFGINLSESDIADFMIIVKVARNAQKKTSENYTDIAGYAGTGDMCL